MATANDLYDLEENDPRYTHDAQHGPYEEWAEDDDDED